MLSVVFFFIYRMEVVEELIYYLSCFKGITILNNKYKNKQKEITHKL